jgi:hypothetical protein
MPPPLNSAKLPETEQDKAPRQAPALLFNALDDVLVVVILSWCAEEFIEQDYMFVPNDAWHVGNITDLLAVRVACRRFAILSNEPEALQPAIISVPGSMYHDGWNFSTDEAMKTGRELEIVMGHHVAFQRWMLRTLTPIATPYSIHHLWARLHKLELKGNLRWLDAEAVSLLCSTCTLLTTLKVCQNMEGTDVWTRDQSCGLTELRVSRLASLRRLSVEGLHELRYIFLGDQKYEAVEVFECRELEHMSLFEVGSLKLNTVGREKLQNQIELLLSPSVIRSLIELSITADFFDSFSSAPRYLRDSEGEVEDLEPTIGFSPRVASILAGNARSLVDLNIVWVGRSARRSISLRDIAVVLSNCPALKGLRCAAGCSNEDWSGDELLAAGSWPPITDARILNLSRLSLENIYVDSGPLRNLLRYLPKIQSFVLTFPKLLRTTGPWPVEAMVHACCPLIRHDLTFRRHGGIGWAAIDSPVWEEHGSSFVHSCIRWETDSALRHALEEGSFDCVWTANGKTCPGGCVDAQAAIKRTKEDREKILGAAIPASSSGVE